MAALVQTTKRIVAGVESIRAAEQLRREQTNRDLWPYEHIYPPPNSKRVHQEFTLTVTGGMVGVTTLIGSYQVQNNFRMMFTGLVQLYIGSSTFTPGDGSITWLLDVNNPIGVAGVVQGYPIQGFSNSGIPKGAYNSGVYAPYPLAPMPEILNPLDTLSSKVKITAAITTGVFITIFEGYLLEL